MGLEVSHDCWDGGYAGFDLWRHKVMEAAGFDVLWPPDYDKGETPDSRLREDNCYPLVIIDWTRFTDDNFRGEWEEVPYDPMLILLVHYDSGGYFMPDHTGVLADRMEEALENLADEPDLKFSLRDKTKQFIDGLRAAHKDKEKVTFG